MYTDKLVRILSGTLALPQDTSNVLDISVPNKQWFCTPPSHILILISCASDGF